MMRHLLVSFTLLVCALCLPSRAEAHALEPGYLEITETAPQSFRVFWRKPDVQQRPMDIVAKLPDHCDASIHPHHGSTVLLGYLNGLQNAQTGSLATKFTFTGSKIPKQTYFFA